MTQREPQTGGLHLPKDIGVSDSEAQTIAHRWSTIGAVDARLKKFGIHDNMEPDIICPIVSAEELTNPDIQRYTVVYAAQLRWYNYAVRLHADIKAVLLGVENEMADIESAKRIHFRQLDEGKKDKDKMSATEMKDLILQDPRYRELRLEEQHLSQQHLKMSAWVESLDRNLKVVSRQIENRRAEASGGSREGNMPGASVGTWEQRQAARGR
jgi:hypothetical protein